MGAPDFSRKLLHQLGINLFAHCRHPSLIPFRIRSTNIPPHTAGRPGIKKSVALKLRRPRLSQFCALRAQK